VAEGELHSFNAILRRRKLPTGRISATPEAQGVKRLAYRIMRKLGV
jgi:hypothetical protein